MLAVGVSSLLSYKSAFAALVPGFTIYLNIMTDFKQSDSRTTMAEFVQTLEPPKATQSAADGELLEHLGHVQELHRSS